MHSSSWQESKRGSILALTTPMHVLRSCTKNMKSAIAHPEPIEEYIMDEVTAGHIIGPLAPELALANKIQVNSFGVIPKPHQPGKWPNHGFIILRRSKCERRS